MSNPIQESMDQEQAEIQQDIDETWNALDKTNVTDSQRILINKLVDSNVEIEKLCNV